MRIVIVLTVILSLGTFGPTFAQTTPFTYQGRVTDGGTPANGSYDFEFRLFDALNGGVQVGTTNALNSVLVTSGVFTVLLDFGLTAFSGPPRFLAISARPAGGPSFSLLDPRQQITSNPYAIRSLNSGIADGLSIACVSCVTSSQIASVSGSVVSGTIPVASVPAGSGNYIQNATSPQVSSNFNISGNGTAGGNLSGNTVNAATQYNLSGARLLSAGGTNNLFAGLGAGNANTGSNNAFFGLDAGLMNSSGGFNTFTGAFAGASNTTGANNSFFGYNTAGANTTGGNNSFFGSTAGQASTTGTNNTFIGFGAGQASVSRSGNTFVGANAGRSNNSSNVGEAENNSFFGASAGSSNTTGFQNSFFGASAGSSNTGGSENSFFGHHAGFSTTNGSRNSFFGGSAGSLNTGGAANSFFGESAGAGNTGGGDNAFFGASAGGSNGTGNDNSFFGNSAGILNTSGSGNVFIGFAAGNTNTAGDSNTTIGDHADVASNNLNHATAIGADGSVSTSNTIALGRSNGSDLVEVYGRFQLDTLGPATTNLCFNSANRIGTCSSSLRYKTSVQSFMSGLDIVRRLRPITFNWIDGGMRDVGFAAEEVEKIEPLLTIRNSKGEIEGVKYGQITTVLVNAVQQQQAQIAEQQVTIKEQQRQLEALKKLVCLSYLQAESCK